MPFKCSGCGQFIGYADIENSRAYLHFEPASHFGPEISEWVCARCVDAERVKLNEVPNDRA